MMRFRDINFIENWLVSHVTEADDYGSHERAEQLAAQLRTDAIAQGVTVDDFEAEAPDLASLIYKTMHHGFAPNLPTLERQVAEKRPLMNLLLAGLSDLKSHNTIIGQWRDGVLIDVTSEWIAECELMLDCELEELKVALKRHRDDGGDFTL